MRRFPALRDVWTLRLAGLCAGLGLLLLVNSLWRPEARLPSVAEGNEAALPAAEASASGAGLPPDAANAEAPQANVAADAPLTEVSAELAAQERPRRAVKPLPAYGTTLQRPLFHATRRPAPVAPVAEAPPKPKAPPRSNLDGVRLTGVIMTAAKAFGLLSIPGQSELMRAPVGHVVKGWRVTQVEAAALVLNNGEEDFRMALYTEKPGQGPVPGGQMPQAQAPPGVIPGAVGEGRQ